MHFSPSDIHWNLMNSQKPTMQFGGQSDFSSWQAELRGKLREMLGVMPSEPCDLDPKELWKREHPLGSIEKVVFTSEPYADIPAYVCLPKGVEPPYTFVICLQGHSTGMHNSIAVQKDDESQPAIVEGDRDFGIKCMERGLAAICIEQRSFGERWEKKQERLSGRGCHEAAMHALMLGRTLIGERVYDVDRAIDYLATRGDADLNRIGVMGNSGGGTISMFSAAVLPRLAFAMPSCYFCTFKASVMSIYHCTCNFVPGLLNVAEMADIMGLFSPKPVVIVAGRDDDIFPIEDTKREFERLKTIYEEAGAGEKCHLVVGDGGHRFYADDAWPVMLKQIEQLPN